MIVKDLINKLKNYDENLEVKFLNEYGIHETVEDIVSFTNHWDISDFVELS